jgi:hypothetical protein
VAAIATIKLVLAVAAHFNMVCFQFDVEGAFLLPDIDHVVYIADEQGNYYRCHKTLYGLKQSPRVWNQDLDTELKQHGMIQSKHDPCLYTRRTERGWMIMASWVDDCVGACTVPAQRDEFYKNFRYPFSSTSDLDYCLKIKVDHMVDDNGDVLIGLSQPISIEAIAHEYSVQDSNPVSTPMQANAKFSKLQSPSPGTPEHEYMEKVPHTETSSALWATLRKSLVAISPSRSTSWLPSPATPARRTGLPSSGSWSTCTTAAIAGWCSAARLKTLTLTIQQPSPSKSTVMLTTAVASTLANLPRGS